MRLEALFHLFGHARKLNPHAHAGVAGANNGAGRNAFLVDPELHPQRCRHRQRHHRLNITAIAADIGGVHSQRRVDALVAQFERKRNLVPKKFAALFLF